MARICVVGLGYVGVVTGAIFAEMGHHVVAVDVIPEKVDALNAGESSIYEPGLDELLKDCVPARFNASMDMVAAVADSDITFLCVGTPSTTDGGQDTSYLEASSKSLGEAIAAKGEYHVVVVKSTVLPGTTDTLVKGGLEAAGITCGEDFGLAMNPEFLREGSAVQDAREPDRVVIGGFDQRSIDETAELYVGIGCPFVETDLRTAEMIKYASNSFLATKISFANELSRLCEAVGIDVYEVMDGIALDNRIKRSFLNAGMGFGGSCFPKDVRALVSLANSLNLDSALLSAVLDVNRSQPLHGVDLLEAANGTLAGKRIAILGLAFKGNTDDVRETRALPVAEELKKRGAVVVGYDPEAAENFKAMFPDIEIVGSIHEALTCANGCIIQAEWDEFRELSADDVDVMADKVVVDGRRIVEDVDGLEESGAIYIGIGLGSIE